MNSKIMEKNWKGWVKSHGHRDVYVYSNEITGFQHFKPRGSFYVSLFLSTKPGEDAMYTTGLQQGFNTRFIQWWTTAPTSAKWSACSHRTADVCHRTMQCLCDRNLPSADTVVKVNTSLKVQLFIYKFCLFVAFHFWFCYKKRREKKNRTTRSSSVHWEVMVPDEITQFALGAFSFTLHRWY